MAKPPPATPHSDIEGVHRDMSPDHQPVGHDPEQMQKLIQRSAEDRARPPRNSNPQGDESEPE